jgi:hypothetical protein
MQVSVEQLGAAIVELYASQKCFESSLIKILVSGDYMRYATLISSTSFEAYKK